MFSIADLSSSICAAVPIVMRRKSSIPGVEKWRTRIPRSFIARYVSSPRTPFFLTKTKFVRLPITSQPRSRRNAENDSRTETTFFAQPT